jgi:hypothetical protein
MIVFINRRSRLTREEREEAYNKARQRIFGSVEKTENSNQGRFSAIFTGITRANGDTADGEDSNGVSRASSVSAKDKPNSGKRKPKRRDDSEGFEPRSQYIAWCGPQHPTWGASAPQYFPVNAAPFNGQFQQQPYPNTPQPMYAPAQPYTPQMPNNGFNPQYTAMPTVSPRICLHSSFSLPNPAAVPNAAYASGCSTGCGSASASTPAGLPGP